MSAGKASAPNPHPSPAAMAAAAFPIGSAGTCISYAAGATAERRRMLQVLIDRAKAAIDRDDATSIGAASELNAIIEELLASLDGAA